LYNPYMLEKIPITWKYISVGIAAVSLIGTIAAFSANKYYRVAERGGDINTDVLYGNIKGILGGTVSVGPLCPVERIDRPCSVPPEAYTSRGVVVFASDGVTVVDRRRISADGTFQFILSSGEYIIDLEKTGFGNNSKDVPARITVIPGQTTKIHIDIDTGIR